MNLNSRVLNVPAVLEFMNLMLELPPQKEKLDLTRNSLKMSFRASRNLVGSMVISFYKLH